jgi:hypothetical protein
MSNQISFESMIIGNRSKLIVKCWVHTFKSKTFLESYEGLKGLNKIVERILCDWIESHSSSINTMGFKVSFFCLIVFNSRQLFACL